MFEKILSKLKYTFLLLGLLQFSPYTFAKSKAKDEGVGAAEVKKEMKDVKPMMKSGHGEEEDEKIEDEDFDDESLDIDDESDEPINNAPTSHGKNEPKVKAK